MERHIVEILVILMREYPEGVISQSEFESLNKSMTESGYTQHEIETALFWYHSRQVSRDCHNDTGKFGRNSFRVLHDVERSIISPKAYGYLLELNQLGLLNLSEMDNIIEKSVLLSTGKVDIDDIKMFVAAQIMEQDSNQTMSGLSQYMKMPSSRIQ